jgi:glyoxylase-like metal-dependent hydrolase (beta-lactamase superfamily II)
MKLRLLDFGGIKADQGWFLEGAGAALNSAQAPESIRRDVKMMGALIEHPKSGVILYDVGPAANYKELWPEPVQDVFPITSYSTDNQLDKQLEKAGYTIKDVSAVIISHMHLDHAGGLEHFRGTDVPVYVHETELKYAFYAVATKQDFGAYIPHYIDPSFNWKAIHGQEVQLFDGITVFLIPGHTPGLLGMKVDTKNSNPFIFTSDTFFFKENYETPNPPGWLVRDMFSWWESLEKIQTLAARSNANIVFGHDYDVFAEYTKEKYYD